MPTSATVLFCRQILFPMNHFGPENDSLESPDWRLLAKDVVIWVLLAYQVVIRETYVFPYVIAFPYMVFIFTSIVSTMHTTYHHYRRVPLVHQCLKSICSVLSTFTLSISILESIMFFSTMWMYPDMMPHYTTIESGHVTRAVFIRAIPLLSNVLIFFSNDTSFGLHNLLLAFLFFSVYHTILQAHLPSNNGMFVHRFLDLMTVNQRICLFVVFLPMVSSVIMLMVSCIKYAITDDGCTVVYRSQAAGSKNRWVWCLLLCALCTISSTYYIKTGFGAHII